jgi:hypothetical protein
MFSVVLGKIKNFVWKCLAVSGKKNKKFWLGPPEPDRAGAGPPRGLVAGRDPPTAPRHAGPRLACQWHGAGMPVATCGTARAARGWGSPSPLSGQRRRPRLCHQLLTGMARGVSAIAQIMMVTMLILPLAPTDAAGMR